MGIKCVPLINRLNAKSELFCTLWVAGLQWTISDFHILKVDVTIQDFNGYDMRVFVFLVSSVMRVFLKSHTQGNRSLTIFYTANKLR